MSELYHLLDGTVIELAADSRVETDPSVASGVDWISFRDKDGRRISIPETSILFVEVPA